MSDTGEFTGLEETKAYLGDGVYARFDGFMVWLSLDGQEATNHPTRIALEPAVLASLDKYRERCRREVEARRESP